MRRPGMVALAFALAIASPAVVHAQARDVREAPIPPAPKRWVTDTVGLLSDGARARLDAQLERYERDTGHQVVVWIGDTLGGAPLDDWAVRTFAAWKIGRKGLDDGIAMFIHARDRTIDIEVGYGLEGDVPDVVASRVIREVMAPRLRAGDADGAVQAGVDAILSAIEGRPVRGGEGGGSVTDGASGAPRPGVRQVVPMALIGLVLLLLFIFNPRLALLLLWSIGHGGHGGGGGGGGFGGGGGRSGGGGSRGSW
jgi:uncharacterized protein